MKNTPMRNRMGFLITLPGELVETVDNIRERLPRSRYIEEAIREKLENDGVKSNVSEE